MSVGCCKEKHSSLGFMPHFWGFQKIVKFVEPTNHSLQLIRTSVSYTRQSLFDFWGWWNFRKGMFHVHWSSQLLRWSYYVIHPTSCFPFVTLWWFLTSFSLSCQRKVFVKCTQILSNQRDCWKKFKLKSTSIPVQPHYLEVDTEMLVKNMTLPKLPGL